MGTQGFLIPTSNLVPKNMTLASAARPLGKKSTLLLLEEGLEGESLYRVTASLCPLGNSEFGHFGEVDQGLLHCLKGTFLSLEES